MPSQLIENEHIYFMCARDFTFNGKDYKMGDKFPQEDSLGKIETMVRTRRLVAVVKDTEHKPRHWHHHVWLEKDARAKLKLINKDDELGESLYNKPAQLEIQDASDSTDEVVRDESQEIRDSMMRNIEMQEEEMDKEREENLDKERVAMKDGEPVTIDGIEQTEPLERVEPPQGQDISDLTDDTGGDYSPHDGDVDEENLTQDNDDADDDKTVKSGAAKKTAAKKAAPAKKKS